MNGKPNIIYVFADQLRYTSVGCSGNRQVRTPNMDKLAAEGIVMDSAFSSCPICSPYRAELLSGLYAHQNGVVCNEYEMRHDIATLPQCLRDAGYRTAYVGKWHLGYGPYTEEKRYGFDYMAATDMPKNSYRGIYYFNEDGPYELGANWLPCDETDISIRFVKDHCKNNPDQPFMLMMSWIPPHWPYETLPERYNIYKPEEIELTPNIPEQLAEFEKKETALYYGNITGLDDQLGRLMELVDQLGISDNTIFCFSSDHGDHLGAHGYGKPRDSWLHHSKRGSKATPYDESVHVPFIMRWPQKIAKGVRSNVIFNSVDIMPTLLSLAEVPVPETLAGRDLSFAFLGKNGEVPESAFFQILGQGWPHRGPWLGYWRGVRTDRYVYARWWDPDFTPMLFDREKDPWEMNNCYGKPEYAEIQDHMEKLLQEWLEKTGDPFDYGERDPETHMLCLGQRFTHEKWYR